MKAINAIDAANNVNKFYNYEKSKQFVVFVLHANIGLVWERSNWI